MGENQLKKIKNLNLTYPDGSKMEVKNKLENINVYHTKEEKDLFDDYY